MGAADSTALRHTKEESRRHCKQFLRRSSLFGMLFGD
jgi:hypothetical protein